MNEIDEFLDFLILEHNKITKRICSRLDLNPDIQSFVKELREADVDMFRLLLLKRKAEKRGWLDKNE